uniref:uncharacterized protein LOC127070072 n=1 Tax=Vespula vulgaris TaxID=7454 RepID=UPI002141569C|nr:uncharacterized protein LOC127070072 [Vespula vulgaris]
MTINNNVTIVIEYRINVNYDTNLKMVYIVRVHISMPRVKLRAIKKIDLRLTFTPNKKFFESMLNKKMKKKKKKRIQETRKSKRYTGGNEGESSSDNLKVVQNFQIN